MGLYHMKEIILIFRKDLKGLSIYIEAQHIGSEENQYIKYIAWDNHHNNIEENFNIINNSLLERLIDKFTSGYSFTVSVFRFNEYKRRSRFYPTIPTCVGFAKYLLGIYNPLIITPKQLFYYIKRY